jgi:hypothetical protein
MPFDVAVSTGSSKAERVLMQNGANVVAKTTEGSSGMHYAASSGSFDVLKLILDRYVEISSSGFDYSVEIDNIDDGNSPHSALPPMLGMILVCVLLLSSNAKPTSI